MSTSAPMPFENVQNLLSQMHAELVPLAIREIARRRRANPSVRAKLLYRVRSTDTDDQLRAWLHTRATMAQWIQLSQAMTELFRCLKNGGEENVRARSLVAEIVGCPTLLNASRLALRGPIHPEA